MYKFCPLCKGKLERKNPGLYICSSCRFHFYNNPKPTTAVFLINSKGEIFLVKRGREPKKGYWDSPGGFIEIGENAEESAKREVKEELGIEIKGLSYIGSFTGTYLYQGVNYSTLCLAYFVKLKKEPSFVLEKEEIKEARFFKKDEIPWEKIAFEDVKAALKKLLSSL